MTTEIIMPPKFRAFVGPMFSSKTDELMAEAGRYYVDGRWVKSVVYFRPEKDRRQEDPEQIISRRGTSFPKEILKATIFGDSEELWEIARKFDVVALDEGQFGDDPLPKALLSLYHEGKKVVFSGLDLDWRGIPFPITSEILSYPEAKVTRLRAPCSICGSEKGTRSQLLDDSRNPVPVDQPMSDINLGGPERFRTTCLKCWFKTTPGAKEARLVQWAKDPEVVVRPTTEGICPSF